MASVYKIGFRFLCFQLLLCLVCSGPVGAAVTGVLQGTVSDSTTGIVLPGVNVIIRETGQGAASGTDGRYTIDNIRAGTYTVTVSMIGYRKSIFSGIVILQDHITRLDVHLVQTSVQAEAVIISAARPAIQTDVTGTEYTIDSDEIIEAPLDTYTDIIGLRPGTTLEGNIRGGKTREVAYMIDGMAASDMMQGGTGTPLPLSAISQMNVRTGGFTAEYGNALSGVVSIVTKRGGDTREYMARAEKDNLFGGTEHSRKTHAEFSAGGPIQKERAHFFTANEVQYSGTRWWQDMQNFFSMPFDRRLNGFTRLDWTPGPSKRLSVQAIYSSRQWKDYLFSWRYNLDGLPSREKNSVRTAAVWTHTITDKMFYTLNLSYSYLHSILGDGDFSEFDALPPQYDFFLQYILAGTRMWRADQSQHIYAVKGELCSRMYQYHLVKAGAEITQFAISADTRKLDPQLSPYGKPLMFEPLLEYSYSYRYMPRSGHFYIQDKIEAGNEGSVIQLGLRVSFMNPQAERPAVELVPVSADEYNEQVTGYIPASVKWQVCPRAGVSFPVSDNTFFFLNYGHYIQFPLFTYLYSGLNNVQLDKGVQVLRGNPDLLPEHTQAWEISMRYEPVTDIVFTGTFFNKETKNQIDSKTFVPSNSRIAGDYGFAEYVNNPHARAWGLELSVTSAGSRPVRGMLSYTYMVAKGLSEYADQSINYAQWGFPVLNEPIYLSWDQRHTVTADISAELPWQVQCRILASYHSGRPYTFYPSSDGYYPDYPDMPFMPNNKRMDSACLLHVKVIKKILGKAGQGNISMSAYVDVRNLFDAKNVLWMDSSGRAGGELGDPSAFCIGRRTSIGLQCSM